MATAAIAQTQQPFRVGIELPTMLPVDPAVELMLKDVGVNYLSFYVYNNSGPTEQDAMAVYDAQAALAKRLGAEYQLECHHVDIPEAVVRKAALDPLCNGVLIDELEHIRLLWRLNPAPAKFLADVNSFTDLYDAHDKAVAGWKELGDKYRSWGIKNLNSTHVWPVLLSVAAEGGWNPTPKICKEFFSPVSLAVGMGAALQYDKPLMVDCDLWFWDMVPGHSAEEYRSNLLLAYWSGADGVYTEGAGADTLYPAGRQGLPHSLMAKISDTEYALSPHGEVLRWFIKDYIPAHPRPWSFRDIKPDIAIIRFDDSCFGQRYTWLPDTLYGSPKLHSDADTEAIFQVWNVLTGGHTGRDGISYFRTTQNMYGYEYTPMNTRRDSYLTRPMMSGSHNFWTPLNNVVVFDDTVTAERLGQIPCLFVTGKRISAGTWQAIQDRVKQGATCVIWAPLAVKLGLEPKGDITELPMGKGKMIIATDFGLTPVTTAVWSYIGRADQIRYRFKQGEVVFKKVDENRVDVQTTVYPKP
ncbi:MAG: hypothetical protein ACYC1M_14720 [Armatimonadota bacterium]